MQKEFKILKSRPKVKVTVSRDSVCAGDDCVSHEEQISIPTFTDPDIFAFQIASKYGLPNITGGQATWICEFNGIKIAVLAQQWTSAKALVRSIEYKKENEVFFAYYAQDPPEKYTKKG